MSAEPGGTGGSTLRRFEPRDLEPLLSLVHQTIRSSYAEAYSKEAIEFFIRYHDRASILRDAEEGFCLVAEADGRLVATGTLKDGEIKRVFVLPSTQGQGLGRKVMAGLIDEAVRLGVRELGLDSSAVSNRFYEAMGFSVVSDEHIDLGNGGRLDYRRMVRRL